MTICLPHRTYWPQWKKPPQCLTWPLSHTSTLIGCKACSAPTASLLQSFVPCISVVCTCFSVWIQWLHKPFCSQCGVRLRAFRGLRCTYDNILTVGTLVSSPKLASLQYYILKRNELWRQETRSPNYQECWNIRSRDYSFPGTFVPMMELSFSGPFILWNIRSLDRSFPETFVPWTVRSLDHSFLRPNLTRKIPSLDYDRSNTSFIVYVKWSLKQKYYAYCEK